MSRDHRQMEKDEIARDILAYLAEHPDAQDTLDGIVQWWLLDRKIKYQKALVKEAIAELVQKGFVLECKVSKSLLSYRLIYRQQIEEC
jgi:hypothetical protein